MVDEFGVKPDIVSTIDPICIKLIVIGSVVWVTSVLILLLLVMMSERIGKKTRVAYL
jgi:hypothetical protein